MKVVILAGGLKSTIDEYNEGIPKPMAEIGEHPILWHIMKYFTSYGQKDFIICGGYKIEDIKEYFTNYYLYQSDITVDLNTNQLEIHKKRTEDWKVTIINTGLNATIGDRIKQIEGYIGEEDFLVSYGDCLSDIDIVGLIRTHQEAGNLATLSVAKPTGRNEVLPLGEEGYLLSGQYASPQESCAWVDACCMVLSHKAFTYLEWGCDLQRKLFEMADSEKVGTYKHNGFWTPIETKRDKVYLENMIRSGTAPWIRWE